jgi:quinol monooxygenase YgiN
MAGEATDSFGASKRVEVDVPKYAIFILHEALPGKRDEVQQVWRKHMMPAITANEGHEAYFYCFGSDQNTICAFQQYTDCDGANAFLETPAYAAYLDEVSSLLSGEPEVTVLDVIWSKGVVDRKSATRLA